MSKVKGKNDLEYQSPCAWPGQCWEGSQSITSNIWQVISGKILISLRDIHLHSAQTDTHQPPVVYTFMMENKDGTDRLSMEMDANLIRTKKQGRNGN